MSATPQGAVITRTYRLALHAQAIRVAAVLAAAWQGVDPAAIDASVARVLPACAAAITGGQSRASEVSYAYLRRFVAAELGVPLAGVDIPPADLSKLIGSTIKNNTVARAVGFEPIYAKKLILAGRGAEEATALALTNLQLTGRSELYRVANESLRLNALNSEHVDRYQRIASPTACSFCRMLAGRGPVYRLETSGFRSHRTCGCTAEPVVRAA